MERQHWQPWLVGVIGLWLIASPFALGVPFQDAVEAGVFRWSFVGPGVLVLLLGISAQSAHQTWETGLAGAVGLWLCVMPWTVGFADTHSAVLSAVASGMVLIALGAWSVVGGSSKRAD